MLYLISLLKNFDQKFDNAIIHRNFYLVVDLTKQNIEAIEKALKHTNSVCFTFTMLFRLFPNLTLPNQSQGADISRCIDLYLANGIRSRRQLSNNIFSIIFSQKLKFFLVMIPQKWMYLLLLLNLNISDLVKNMTQTTRQAYGRCFFLLNFYTIKLIDSNLWRLTKKLLKLTNLNSVHHPIVIPMVTEMTPSLTAKDDHQSKSR